MRIGLTSNLDYFYGSGATSDRYLSHIAYAAKALGHEVELYTEREPYYGDGKADPDGLVWWRNGHLVGRKFDLFITPYRPDQFQQFMGVPLDTPDFKQVAFALDWYGQPPDITRKHYDFVMAPGASPPEEAPNRPDDLPYYIVPVYVPPRVVDMPFAARRHRVFDATPTEDVMWTYPNVQEGLRQIRERHVHPHLVEHHRMKGDPTYYVDDRQYNDHLLMRHNSYTHAWLTWDEYLFVLQTTGILIRYSWADSKTGISEALAYGCIVVLYREHSLLYYDEDDVILLEWSPDENEGRKSPDNMTERIYETVKEILTDPVFPARSRQIEDKYSARHSLDSVMACVRKALDENCP